jgi:hypothetical protein
MYKGEDRKKLILLFRSVGKILRATFHLAWNWSLQEDHKQSLLEEKGVDVTICSLLFSMLERIHGDFDNVFEAFHPDSAVFIIGENLYWAGLTVLIQNQNEPVIPVAEVAAPNY